MLLLKYGTTDLYIVKCWRTGLFLKNTEEEYCFWEFRKHFESEKQFYGFQMYFISNYNFCLENFIIHRPINYSIKGTLG